MTTDPISAALESVDRPLMPDPAFADQLLDRLLTDLGAEGSPSRPQHVRAF